MKSTFQADAKPGPHQNRSEIRSGVTDFSSPNAEIPLFDESLHVLDLWQRRSICASRDAKVGISVANDRSVSEAQIELGVTSTALTCAGSVGRVWRETGKDSGHAGQKHHDV